MTDDRLHQQRLSDTRGSGAGIAFFKLWYGAFGYTHTKVLVWVVTFFYMLFDSAARKKVDPYIRHRFPKAGVLGRCKHRWFIFAHQGMCLLWQELYDQLGRTYEVVYDSEEAKRISQSKAAVVVLYSHFGPWQLMMRTLVTTRNFINIMAQDDRNANVDKMKIFSERDLAKKAAQVSTAPGNLLALQQALERGEFIALMGDRNFEPSPLAVDYLGETAYFPIAAFHLAARAKCPVLCMFAHYDGRRYVMECCEPMHPEMKGRNREQLRPYLERYTKHLEKLCMDYPYDCFSMTNHWIK